MRDGVLNELSESNFNKKKSSLPKIEETLSIEKSYLILHSSRNLFYHFILHYLF